MKNKIKLKILTQIARGLDIMNRAKLIHGDLKPPNILLDKYENAKIADFGTTKLLQNDKTLPTSRLIGNIYLFLLKLIF